MLSMCFFSKNDDRPFLSRYFFKDIRGAFLTTLYLVLCVGSWYRVSMNASTSFSLICFKTGSPLCSLGWPGTHRDPPVSASQMLGKRHAPPCPSLFFLSHLISGPVCCHDCGTGQSREDGGRSQFGRITVALPCAPTIYLGVPPGLLESHCAT